MSGVMVCVSGVFRPTEMGEKGGRVRWRNGWEKVVCGSKTWDRGVAVGHRFCVVRDLCSARRGVSEGSARCIASLSGPDALFCFDSVGSAFTRASVRSCVRTFFCYCGPT